MRIEFLAFLPEALYVEVEPDEVGCVPPLQVLNQVAQRSRVEKELLKQKVCVRLLRVAKPENVSTL